MKKSSIATAACIVDALRKPIGDRLASAQKVARKFRKGLYISFFQELGQTSIVFLGQLWSGELA
jgi:hypothetical protein